VPSLTPVKIKLKTLHASPGEGVSAKFRKTAIIRQKETSAKSISKSFLSAGQSDASADRPLFRGAAFYTDFAGWQIPRDFRPAHRSTIWSLLTF
jgi:hypothetical protein